MEQKDTIPPHFQHFQHVPKQGKPYGSQAESAGLGMCYVAISGREGGQCGTSGPSKTTFIKEVQLREMDCTLPEQQDTMWLVAFLCMLAKKSSTKSWPS